MKYLTTLIIAGAAVIGSTGSANVIAASTVASDIIVSRPASNVMGFYVGGSIGNASYNEADDSDIGFDLFVGLDLNEVLSVELGWANFGEAENAGSIEVTALHAAMVGHLSLQNDLSLVGKLGIFSWDADLTVGSSTTSDSDTDVFFGLSVDYEITGKTSVRFGIDRYAIDEEDITVYSVGIKQRF